MKKTISDYIKEIIERSAKEKRKEFKKRLKWRPVTTLSRRLQISPEEALIFAYAYYLSLTEKTFNPIAIREEISDSPFDIGIVLENIQKLQKQNLILGKEATVKSDLSVTSKVLSDISLNRNPIQESSALKKDFFDLCDELFDIFWFRMESMYSLDEFYTEMDNFYEKNRAFEVFAHLKSEKIPQNEWLIFLYTFLCHLNGEENASLKKGIRKLYKGINIQFHIRKAFVSEEAHLIKNKLIAFEGDRLQSASRIKVSEKSMKAILKDNFEAVMSDLNVDLSSEGLIEPENITRQKLFYNKKEKEQLDVIKRILDKKKLKNIQKRLEKSGHRTGVCILFHGTPGTGKTESVLQLAKNNDRAIFKIDIASIRDKFVGESEKNLSAVFKKYERIRKESKITPILLFNEADAILNKRVKVRQSSDQMNNTMQNILLEELENFKGILIATTNLTPNLDSAFERRFLYKVKFESPGTEVRKAIWSAHFPKIELTEIEKIASTYKLSGGQIENVVRKVKMDHILNGGDIEIPHLENLCKQEYMNAPKAKPNKIGYIK